MTKEREEALEAAFACVLRVPPPDNPPVDGWEWTRKHGISYAASNALTGESFGFGVRGMQAVRRFALQLLDTDAEYRRGADTDTFIKATADVLIGYFRTLPEAPPLPREALDTIEARLRAWFKAEAVPQVYFVPCAVVPTIASSFTVGPVRFVHGENFAAERSLDPGSPIFQLNFDQLFKFMKERHGYWIAQVAIQDCEPSRATEMADLAVDLALIAIQLSLPLHYSRNMSRISGKMAPPWLSAVHETDGQMRSRTSNQYPGYGYMALDEAVSLHRPVLESVGNRIEHYLRGTSELSTLEQAWCDSAYWYHEGLAEPIDTIAVAKLETALEVLLTAESTSGSKARLIEAFAAFFGLGKNDAIGTAGMTVDSYVKDIVKHRSMVLHGTASTLRPRERLPRLDLEVLGWQLLTAATSALDQFALSPDRSDKTTSFLKWVANNRNVASP